jgi:peptidoglycan/xylan/chitin deacetylase (PgdA/CDA1 family)
MRKNLESRRGLLKTFGAATLGPQGLASAGSPLWASASGSTEANLIVLTFDDAVKNHRTFVAPLLKQLGFGATFFVTHCWMVKWEDPYTQPADYMTWPEIAELHALGFEIGNHSWSHPNFAIPKNAAGMPDELALVDDALKKVGVPRPISYAHTGNHFGPEAIEVLKAKGYILARRGQEPEAAVGSPNPVPIFDPQKHHHLLIPSTVIRGADFEYFKKTVDRTSAGHIVILQYHGIPDPHDFASTPQKSFEDCMGYLKQQKFRVVALRELIKYLPAEDPKDPLLKIRYSVPQRT